MTDKLTKYAESQGLNPARAGEVLLAAAEVSRAVTGDLNATDLFAIGIGVDDNKVQIKKKIEATLHSDGSSAIFTILAQQMSPGLPLTKELDELIRFDLRKILEWLED